MTFFRRHQFSSRASLFLCFGAMVSPVWAAASSAVGNFAWTSHWIGYLAISIFVLAYMLVVLEEKTHLRKSKPVMLAAGLIWGLIAWKASQTEGLGAEAAKQAFDHIFLEFAQLFFFLIVAMSYVSAMTERNIFEALRAELVKRGFSFRQLFWLTGIIAFFLSAILDNLTTALIMSAVILAVGQGNAKFISLSFINLVVAANAGGAWSAFGDITTLMVWQAHRVEFFEFFSIFIPSLINWSIPASLMHFSIPQESPKVEADNADIRYGGIVICIMFAITIALTVAGKQFLNMPPVFGMMFGLALLKVYGYVIQRAEHRLLDLTDEGREPYSIFRIIANAEWDTLLFFYGVLLCVGGLATIGYLELTSVALYGGLGHTWANVIMGTASAVVDNIPIMFAVLQMSPPMDHGQWLLITLTCGVGGSMLSVGSAAGVALMGQSKGYYTFFTHLRWTWAVALGYIASIIAHLLINARFFTNGIWH